MGDEIPPIEPPIHILPWPPRCDGCKFWNKLEPPEVPTDRGGQNLFNAIPVGHIVGRCQAHPPGPGKEPWGTCYDSDWCGEWVAIPEPSPPPDPPP